jgi:hypothetical protein
MVDLVKTIIQCLFLLAVAQFIAVRKNLESDDSLELSPGTLRKISGDFANCPSEEP